MNARNTAANQLRGILGLAIFVLLVGGPWCLAQEASPPLTAPSSNPQTVDPLQQARQWYDQGQLGKAIAAAEAAIPPPEQTLEDASWDEPLDWLAARQEDHGDWERALQTRQRLLRLRLATLGEMHWSTLEAQVHLNATAAVLRMSEPQRSEVQACRQQLVQAISLREQLKAEEANLLLEQVIHRFDQLGISNHPQYSQALLEHGICLRDLKRWQEAEQQLRRALEILANTLGEGNPETCRCMAELAWAFQDQSDSFLARHLMGRSVELLQQSVGEKDPRFVQRLEHVALLIASSRDFDSAISLLEHVVRFREELNGKQSAAYAKSQVNLATLLLIRGDLERAATLITEAITYHESAAEVDHLDYASALHAQFVLAMNQNDLIAAEAILARKIAQLDQANAVPSLARADDYKNLGVVRIGLDRHSQAMEDLQRSLQIRRQLGEENTLPYAVALRQLGVAYHSSGNFEQARSAFQSALDAHAASNTTNTEDYVQCLEQLALCYQNEDDFVQAESLFTKVLEIRETLSGTNSQPYLNAMGMYAELLVKRGHLASARRQWEEIARRVEQSIGKSSEPYAFCLLGIAQTYLEHDARRERTIRDAIEVAKGVAGEASDAYREGLNRLFDYYLASHKYDQAIEVLREATELARRLEGEGSRSYAQHVNRLAAAYASKQDWGEARPLAELSLSLSRRWYGDGHPATVDPRTNLALVLSRVNELPAAAELYAENLRLCEQLHGKQATETIECMARLAGTYVQLQQPERAETLYRDALERELAAGRVWIDSFSQFAQVRTAAARRHLLNAYLSLAVEGQAPASEAYRFALAWKGHQLAVQWLSKRTADEAFVKQLSRLYELDAELANHALRQPDPDDPLAWQRRGENLAVEKDRIIAGLAEQAAKTIGALSPPNAEDIKGVLPQGVVLLDFFEYEFEPWRFAEKSDNEDSGSQKDLRLLAFVLQPGASVKIVALGTSSDIAAKIESWRENFGNTPESKQAGVELRQLAWAPFDAEVSGAEQVLVSPDGPLGRLPFNALPGSRPDSYLIEEVAISVWPATSILPAILAAPPLPEQEASLLLVGALDYDFDFKQATTRSGGVWADTPGAKVRFQALPGAEREVTAIDALHRELKPNREVALLTGSQADEAAVRTKFPRYRQIHLATHGYYLPTQATWLDVKMEHSEEAMPLLMYRMLNFASSPGILSGIALSGANHPDAEHDGVLTAEEVASLELSQVDLVVLSACETGLGFDLQVSSEGLFGLQRAFHAAGVRTTVASLWTVPDQATRELMERFYKNLWSRGMGKAAALREAQLWMLRDRVSQNPETARGLTEVEDSPQQVFGRRLPPYYWAAFVLSGDWR